MGGEGRLDELERHIENGRSQYQMQTLDQHLIQLCRQDVITLDEAKRLWREVDRRNLMIKVPATSEGLPAIHDLTADGINVNVTLIFSLARYAAVMDAYLSGLEERAGRER